MLFNKLLDSKIIFKKIIRQGSWSIIRAIIIIGLCFIILYPLLVSFSSAFMTDDAIHDQTVKWIPRNPTLENFRFAFIGMDYGQAFVNSLLLTLAVSILQLISATLVGYGFARFKFRGAKLLFSIVIFSIIVPNQTIRIAYYLEFRFFNLFGLLGEEGFNLLGTYWPFILTAMTATGYRNGLYIFIMRQIFKGMPGELEDAAYVDGAGPLKTFYKVMLPGASSGILLVFLFSFVWQWNDVIISSIFLQGGNLLQFNVTSAGTDFAQYYSRTFGGQISGFHYSIINNAALLLFLTPLLVFYGFLQRYFVESIERTGLVG